MKKLKLLLLTFAMSFTFVMPTSALSLLPDFDEAAFKEIANDVFGGDEAAGYYDQGDSNKACKLLIDYVLSELGTEGAKEYIGENENEYTETFLACGIKSGNIEFWMVPYYARHALSFLLAIAGTLSVLMIIVGAYYYIAGGISEDKEKGKNVIKFAIGGLVLTTLAWIIVNFILLLLT